MQAPDPAKTPADIPLTESLLPHRARFLRFLERRLGNLHTAEEILQDALLKTFMKGVILSDERSRVAWFFRLLRNAVTDHFRHRQAEARAILGPSGLPGVDSGSQECSAVRSVCHCVTSQVEQLKPEYACILRRVDLERESLEKFASSMSITANHAKVRLHRARAALRERLEATCCGSCLSTGCLDCTCPK